MKPSDDMKELLQDIKNSIFRIEKDLEYHIKRTDLLESFMKNQIKVLLGVVIAVVSWIITKGN